MKGSFHRYNAEKSIKIIASTAFTFLILSKIYHGYRPSQIAKHLEVSSQSLNYHMNRLIDAHLIKKDRKPNGITWALTDRGLFILKEKLRRSVTNDSIYNHYKLPIRFHSLVFSFRINHIPELNLDWKILNNGVSKCSMNYDDHTAEIVNGCRNSVLLIHLPGVYTFNPFQSIIRQYEAARGFAVSTAKKLKIDMSEIGELVKKPHMAFDSDMIALFLATFETVETPTTSNKGERKNDDKNSAWLDASQGNGELETDDIYYAYKYLMMPEYVTDIHQGVIKMTRRSSSRYAMCNDPTLTDNN